ncbi:glycosyltransferase family 2 protein [Riemerella columbipharyngis]|uniref:Glycosyltransferase involved in cell wall bisynthesis n=1 Tax=Riemerella columbipharyngis TaxID=1071918 RepID=A0A1G7EBH9_9FLAO|nr:glycosyltransferase [Riemerella columbipharyngis]SDE60776.1 Glycosyltransferase involved in cell wall bisynthesis [Riemerella columbipharyngis]
MKPLVTISIPIYKCEDFLEKCLNSVLAQSYSNIEVTLINDQTPDNSVEIAENFIQKHNLSNWRIYHLEKNLGLSVVRNKGIDTAQGKYIFFLDSDDTITPDCIANFVARAEKEAVQMVAGNARTINIETKKELATFKIKSNKKSIIGNDLILKAFIDGDYPSSSWNKLIRTDFLRKHKLYFTKGLFAQDELQSFQTALHLSSIAFIKKEKITYNYYLHKKSVIHNRGKRNFDNWFTIGQYIDKALKEEKDPTRRNLILKYLTNFKSMTLLMNWKAQKNKNLWKESYKNYKTLSSLSILDYFSPTYEWSIKKKSLLNNLPTSLGFIVFIKRYNRL